MKKVVITSLILVIMAICMIGNVYAAITCKVNLQTTKTEFKKNEEFVVDVKLSNLQSKKGIIAFGATLVYDKESLTLVKMEGKNGWATPSYSEDNGKLVMERNGFATKDETLFQITFKFKEESNKNVSIALKSLEVADGNERSKLGDTSITIKKESPNTDVGGNNVVGGNNTVEDGNQNIDITPTPNPKPGTNIGNNQVGKDNSIANTNIPKAGTNNIISLVIVIAFITLISTILYIKIRLMGKEF